MATRFVEQATQQLAPAYDQQIAGLQGQVPAIQSLYDSLVSGLNTQYNTNLNTGVQGIVEDASARGVLRSTLPVDARQALTTQLSQALLEGTGRLNLQKAQDIGGINEKVGTLGIQRAGAITDLARALEEQDNQRQQFAQQMALQQAKGRGTSTKAPTAAQQKQSDAAMLAAELRKVAGKDGYVSPQDYAAAAREWGAAGYTDFEKQFKGFRNPQNTKYKYFLGE